MRARAYVVALSPPLQYTHTHTTCAHTHAHVPPQTAALYACPAACRRVPRQHQRRCRALRDADQRALPVTAHASPIATECDDTRTRSHTRKRRQPHMCTRTSRTPGATTTLRGRSSVTSRDRVAWWRSSTALHTCSKCSVRASRYTTHAPSQSQSYQRQATCTSPGAPRCTKNEYCLPLLAVSVRHS
jgi:hypothetical protein